MRVLLLVLLGVVGLNAAELLRLEDAERTAVQNHPRMAGMRAEATAAEFVADQVRGRRRLQLDGGITASVAEHGTRQGVGGVNAPDLFTRLGMGINFTQLITDFGRTAQAIASATEAVQGRNAAVRVTEGVIRLQVRVAFYRVLQAQAGYQVADEVRRSRDVLLRQIRTLAENERRSTLDVGFAEIRLSESDLLITAAENERSAALIELARAMGLPGPDPDWQLEEPPMRDPLLAADEAIAEAVKKRPELSVLHHQLLSARNQAESDSRLRMPTVNAIGLGGFLPAGDPRLRSRYGGFALTMTVPIFNGRILESRKQESLARALVIEKQREDFLLQLGAAVRLALLNVETARKNIDVSRRLQEHAERTLRLSETRYTAGLGTILEFNQAQVDAATAKLAYASARYAAGMQLARLDFEVGNLQ